MIIRMIIKLLKFLIDLRNCKCYSFEKGLVIRKRYEDGTIVAKCLKCNKRKVGRIFDANVLKNNEVKNEN